MLIAVAGSAFAIALPRVGPAEPAERAQLVAHASGKLLRISNSRSGTAILGASNMRPGQSRSGRVWIANRGREPGYLRLRQILKYQQPGIGGGALINRLTLKITEVRKARRKSKSGPKRGMRVITVFRGTIGAFRKRRVGRVRPHHHRVYRFQVTFPDGGAPAGPTSGDNAYQGARLRVSYRWKLKPARRSSRR